MATVKGVNQALIDTGGVAQIAAGLRCGRVHVATDTVANLAATQTGATDVLKLFGKLPAGAKILMITLMQTGTQTSTISVGTLYSATQFLAAGSTGIQTAQAKLDIPCSQYEMGQYVTSGSEDTQITITFAGAVGATGKLYAEVYYTTD